MSWKDAGLIARDLGLEARRHTKHGVLMVDPATNLWAVVPDLKNGRKSEASGHLVKLLRRVVDARVESV